ncbi:hypothetical protein [Taibaiella koreensis]|uniref:hypothetical protein n=1 Tax=Taibaiella koreensis TaxID=1268548 RepID=UPI000E59D951|nr:hypothetical protein [Taibaiella koreensis]
MDFDKQDILRPLAADTRPFGLILATAVAEKQRSGASLGYSHRDYCGMGMEYNEGVYCYGELWDGGLDRPMTFDKVEAFIAWLTAQSTASLARLEDDAFYQGNQVITRERLEDFLLQQSF